MILTKQSRYYLISFITAALFWLLFYFLDVEFINISFFIMAFFWHFALLAPGVREKVIVQKTRFSFLSLALKFNYYLQMFIPSQKIPFGPSVVRAISPLLFSFLLMVAGGVGNLLFTLLGSLIFEVIYLRLHRVTTQVNKDDPEIPPAIPNAENIHE